PDKHCRFVALRNIAARAGIESGLHQQRFGVHAEDENARTDVTRLDVPYRFKAACPRHRYVQDYNVRGMLLERAVRARRVMGFGDHAEVALMFQYAAVALPDDRMIIGEQDRNFFCLRSHGPTASGGDWNGCGHAQTTGGARDRERT